MPVRHTIPLGIVIFLVKVLSLHLVSINKLNPSIYEFHELIILK